MILYAYRTLRYVCLRVRLNEFNIYIIYVGEFNCQFFPCHLFIFYFQALAGAKRLLPLFDRILIKRAEAITRTKGGIVIPEKAQAKVLQGTVVAVGPGLRNKVQYMHEDLIVIYMYPTIYTVPSLG